MKKVKLFATLMATAMFSSTFVACDDDDETTPAAASSQQTIAAIAQSNAETDSLVVALSRVDLVATFNGSGNFTVFAPNNKAFENVVNSNANWNSIADIDSLTLRNILLYHVLGSEVKSSALTENTIAATLNTEGPNGTNTVLEIDIDGGVTINNNMGSISGASVVTADVDASNGVIHIIDKVITPRNVVQLAQADKRFDSLVVALTQPGFNFATTLSGTGPFTVFAPTNEAFKGLIDSDPTWNSISDIPTVTLDAVLRYHVSSGANVRAEDITAGMTVTTLAQNTFTITGTTISTSTSQSVEIVVTDVQGTNGVVHAIDKVMIP